MNNKTDIIKDFKETRKLCSSPHYKPIITANQYYMNKIQNPDYYNTHVMKNYFDEYCFDMNVFSDIVFTHQNTYRLLNSNIFEPFNPYNVTLLSATLSKITNITNKYLSDKRIYIPGITPRSYYYLSRGYGKSIRELRYFMKLISDSEKSHFSYNPYSPEYTMQNYKSDMENLYKVMISQKTLNSYTTQNNINKQRNNNQEEMCCLKLIADRNNTNKKFHK